ncbi:MAG: hypothetical protein Q7T82_06505 [Armatimonadota bacterium]|nr:hypothetical protein [Armatimonadota bacterium]
MSTRSLAHIVRRIPALLIVAAIAFATPAYVVAQPGVPGTRIHGDILAGYSPVNNVYDYTADFNVRFDFGSYNAAKLYFDGGVLTLIKKTSEKSFQADRYRGTLEPGIRLPHGKNSYALFVKHQSFHDIDRFDGLTESYEILGLRYYLNNPWNPAVSAGNYVHRNDVDYDWDFALSVDNGCIGFCGSKKLYGAASLHYVTEEGALSDRNHFLDYSAEIGLESTDSVRYFLSYRQIHDIDGFDGHTEHGLLVGARYKW